MFHSHLHLQVYSRLSHSNFWPEGRKPNFKMCNFCPIYEELVFASDLRESRISISKKFLSAVPLSADDKLREAGDVTFHCEHAKDWTVGTCWTVLVWGRSHGVTTTESSLSSEVVIARTAARHRTVHIEIFYPNHKYLSDAVCHITDPTTHFLVAETRERWRRRRLRRRHRRSCAVGAPWLWTPYPAAIRLCPHSIVFQHSPHLYQHGVSITKTRLLLSWRRKTHTLHRRLLGSVPKWCRICVSQCRPVLYSSAAFLPFLCFVRFSVKIKSCNLNWSLLIALNLVSELVNTCWSMYRLYIMWMLEQTVHATSRRTAH